MILEHSLVRCVRTLRLAWWAAAVVTPLACSDDGGAGQGDSGSSSGAETSGAASATAGMSSTSAASTGTSTTTTATDTAADTAADSAGFVNPVDTGSDGGTPQPNGAQCANAEGCESGFCYTVPMLGGVCSECLMDADCPTGTCGLDAAAGYAVCTDGSLGKQCDSDEGCMGELVCTQLIDTGGFFNASFCSECGPQAPCPGEQICTPNYDAQALAGYMGCADPASVPDGGGCPIVEGMGDGAVCSSGHCGIADVFMGFVQLGVCGECSLDSDCADGLTCMPAQAGMGGLQGPTCG
ncbi:MAG: hypothetical protein IPK74_15085 [Deltaproteobacteria bacterium]|nr:hypothetical protein [Deltaproteobacteria bacterium]